MNTGEADLDVIGERTAHVLGRSVACGGSGSSAGATALGVFHGILASVRARSGADLAGLRVLVQGVGAVGSHLAGLLRDAGASWCSPTSTAARAAEVASALGAESTPAHHVFDARCDVFSPCATGGVLSAETIPLLRCGSSRARRTTSSRRPGTRSGSRGADILYAPDYVINAGGVIHLAGYERLGWDPAAVTARVAGIGETLPLCSRTPNGTASRPPRRPTALAAAAVVARGRGRAAGR